jgi:hypothetical protein
MVLHSGDRAPIEAEGVAPGSLLGGSRGLNKKTTAE